MENINKTVNIVQLSEKIHKDRLKYQTGDDRLSLTDKSI